MKRLIVVPAIIAAALIAAPQANAAGTPSGPKAQATGMYYGTWAAFANLTEHLAEGKAREVNARPNAYVNMDENPYHSDRSYKIDERNGFLQWNFVAHLGDFTYRYWMNCWFINQKIDCDGPGGGPKWHREIWG